MLSSDTGLTKIGAHEEEGKVTLYRSEQAEKDRAQRKQNREEVGMVKKAEQPAFFES